MKIDHFKPTTLHKDSVWACWTHFFGGEGDDYEHCSKREMGRAQFSKKLREVRSKSLNMDLYGDLVVHILVNFISLLISIVHM